MCPGLLYERHAISPSHLCQHLIQPLSHPSHALLTVLLEQGIMGTAQASDGTLEYLHDVICLGSPDVVGSGSNANGGKKRPFNTWKTKSLSMGWERIDWVYVGAMLVGVV